MTKKHRRKRMRSKEAHSQFIAPSIDYDDTYKDLETVSVPSSKRHDSHSFMFHILQYPILLVGLLNIILDLLLYFGTRAIVFVLEWVKSRQKPQLHSYQEWVQYYSKQDKLLGLEQWKYEVSNIFDEDLIQKTNKKLLTLNIHDLMHTVVNVCKNDFGGIEHEKVYSQLYFGTKDSVEDYVERLMNALDRVGNSDISKDEKYHFFKQVNTTFGRTALCLSGGATLAYFHFGVLKSLSEQQLLPNILTGASAGSIIAAMVCVRTDEELGGIFTADLSEHINALDSTLKQRISAFWKTGALFSDQKFRKEAEWWTKGQTTFLEAYQLTGRVLNITVVSTESHSKSKVLNYINTPHVTINSAVVASSSIPGILPACQLFMKDSIGNIIPYHQSGRFWRDGSMRSDIPEQELHQMFRVKYTVVSQVNPHISLFFYSPQGSAGCPTSFRNGRGFRGGYLLSFLVKYFLLDIFKWLQILRDMHLMPWFLGADFSNVFLQRFEGNVTILPPPPTFRQLFELLRLCDPDRDGLNVLIDNGQQSTWPKIKMISNRMHIEQKIRYWLALCK